MSDFRECIVNARAAGDITRDEADMLMETYDGFERQYRADLGDDAAADDAARATYAALERDRTRKMWHRKLTLTAQNRLKDDLDKFLNLRGVPDAGEFGQQIIESSGNPKRGVSRSVEGRRASILAEALGMIEELTFEFRQGVAGRQVGKARLENVVKEAFGEDTKDPAAKDLARAWGQAAEWLRQRGNAAGMEIGKLENWGLPQAHNGRAVRRFINSHPGGKAAGRAAFKARLMRDLDPARMRDASGKPLTAAALDQALGPVIDNIITDGWASRTPKMVPQRGKKLAHRHNDERFLVFKDAETWQKYSEEFGGGDPFTSMIGHIERMARDIGALEVLGPNPEAMIEWLGQVMAKEAGEAERGAPARLPKVSDPRGYVRRKDARMRTMWDHYTGRAMHSVNDNVAEASQATGNVLTAAHLGSAALAALPTDPLYGAFARNFSGLKDSKLMQTYLTQLGRQDRRKIQQLGVMNDSVLNVIGSQARFAMAVDGAGMSRNVAQQVLAVSGLTALTRGGRQAFGLGVYASLADMRGVHWRDMDVTIRRTMERHGFDELDWEIMRRANIRHELGMDLLTPKAIAELQAPSRSQAPLDVDGQAVSLRKALQQREAQDLADRFAEMIHVETDFAVPSGTLRSRSLMLGKNDPGTASGFFRSSAVMFKSFPMAVWMGWGYRLYAEFAQGRSGRAAAYGASIVAVMTLGGAMSLQLYQLAAGRDPLDMTTAGFWGAAMLKGGALGVYADFLLANRNERGKGAAEYLAGPKVTAIGDLLDLTIGNVMEAGSGDNTRAGREFVKALDAYTPGTGVWYYKTAFDRLIIDQLQFLADPDADRSFRSREQYYERERGQEYFWRPGDVAPGRAPDFEAALGD